MTELLRTIRNYVLIGVAIIVVMWSLINGFWIVTQSGIFF